MRITGKIIAATAAAVLIAGLTLSPAHADIINQGKGVTQRSKINGKVQRGTAARTRVPKVGMIGWWGRGRV